MANGLFPANAGLTSVRMDAFMGQLSIPRTRGADSGVAFTEIEGLLFSPRAWG